MRIVQDERAPNPRRVQIFLKEKNIDNVEFENLSIMEGEHLNDAFAAKNPAKRVPYLLLDDGTAISETMAICRYFEALQPTPPLFGADAKAQGLVEMWNRRAELGLLFHVSQAFRHLHPKMAHLEVPQISAWGEANKGKIIPFLDMFEAQLATQPFLAGDAFSVADITAEVTFIFMKPARIEMPEGYPNIARWRSDLATRPSFAM